MFGNLHKKHGTQSKAKGSRVIYIESQTAYARTNFNFQLIEETEMMPPDSNPLTFTSIKSRIKLVGLQFVRI